MVWLKKWLKHRGPSQSILFVIIGLLPATGLPAAAQSFVVELDVTRSSIQHEILAADFKQPSNQQLLEPATSNHFVGNPALNGSYSRNTGIELRLVVALNGTDSRLFSAWMGAADKSSYPLMFGSVPAWWVAALASNSVSSSDALGFSGAWIATAGSTFLLKRISQRSRPYVSVPALGSRLSSEQRRGLGDYSSFPSGHSSLAAVSASYWILRKQPRLAGPAAAFWAVSIGTSRIWKGVHYPTDVLTGFLLGSAAAFAADTLQ